MRSPQRTKRAIIVVIPEQLVIHFLAGKGRMEPLVPEDAVITGYHHNMARNMIEFRIEHPDFAEVGINESPMVYNLQAPEVTEPDAAVPLITI